MKKVKLLFPYTLCVAVVLIVFASCSKDGATGPAGPAGPAGPTGANGAAGPAGPAGTANVIYSPWTDVTYEPATEDNGSGGLDTLAWLAEMTAARIDANALNNGEIKVYLNAGSAADPAVFPLPITDLYALTGVMNINIYFSVGNISFYATEDASTFTDGADKVWQYRYVVIPGGTAARTANGKKIDWNNYKEVQAYLGLKD